MGKRGNGSGRGDGGLMHGLATGERCGKKGRGPCGVRRLTGR
jgi:hypothetical protein